MKIMKTARFCMLCLMALLLAAVASCAVRARYRSLQRLRAEYAALYLGNLSRYSFLQYSQAGPDQGRTALKQYLALLQRIRAERIPYPARTLHADCGLTYLRLYRLESSVGNLAAAKDYMRSAQKEFAALGWKSDSTSETALSKLIRIREASEARLYNTDGSEESTIDGDRQEERRGR